MYSLFQKYRARSATWAGEAGKRPSGDFWVCKVCFFSLPSNPDPLTSTPHPEGFSDPLEKTNGGEKRPWLSRQVVLTPPEPTARVWPCKAFSFLASLAVCCGSGVRIPVSTSCCQDERSSCTSRCFKSEIPEPSQGRTNFQQVMAPRDGSEHRTAKGTEPSGQKVGTGEVCSYQERRRGASNSAAHFGSVSLVCLQL